MANVYPVPLPTFASGQLLVATDMLKLTSALSFLLTNKPLYRAHSSIDYGMQNAQYTPILFDTIDADTDGGRFGTGSGLDRYVCRTQGWYQVNASVASPAGTVGTRSVTAQVNGTGMFGGSAIAPSSTQYTMVSVSTLVHLNLNDYLQLVFFQDSGAFFNMYGSSYGTQISVYYVAPG